MSNLEEVIISVHRGAENIEAIYKWHGRRYRTSNGVIGQIVRCGECIHCADDWIDVGMGTMPQFTCELGRCGESVQPNDFCSYGEREGE